MVTKKKKRQNPLERQISYFLLRFWSIFFMKDCIFCRVVQLSLTAYLEWVVTPWMLKQCIKKDDMQENTGLGRGEMCWMGLLVTLGLPLILLQIWMTWCYIYSARDCEKRWKALMLNTFKNRSWFQFCIFTLLLVMHWLK